MMDEELYQQLLRDRIIFLNSEIDSDLTNLIVAQLLFLEEEDPAKNIYLYINSPGGSVSGGMAIFDVMTQISPDVCTVCTGFAASMGALLLSSGAKGKRISFSNSRIMINQASAGAQGQATDIAIQAEEILYIKGILNGILAENTGQPLEKILADTADGDFYMSAEEAKDYGLVDTIMDSPGSHQSIIDLSYSLPAQRLYYPDNPHGD